MTVRHALVLIAALTTGACQAAAPPAAGDRDSLAVQADIQAVEATLRGWYDAVERRDSAAWVAPLHPEFFIVEDTTVYDKPSLTKLVVASFLLGIDRASLSEFRTQVNGNVAWTTFRNSETWTPTDGQSLEPRRFLETVVFRREGGKWMMERYHATRINRQ